MPHQDTNLTADLCLWPTPFRAFRPPAFLKWESVLDRRSSVTTELLVSQSCRSHLNTGTPSQAEWYRLTLTVSKNHLASAHPLAVSGWSHKAGEGTVSVLWWREWRRHGQVEDTNPPNYPSTTVQVFFCSFSKTSKCARCTNVQHYITWGLLTSPGYNHFLQLSRTYTPTITCEMWLSFLLMRFWSELFNRKRLEIQKSHFEVLIFLFHNNNEPPIHPSSISAYPIYAG